MLPNVDNDTPIVIREKNANNLSEFQDQLSRTDWSGIMIHIMPTVCIKKKATL